MSNHFSGILVFASLFAVAALVVGLTHLLRESDRTSTSPVRRADRGRVRYWLKHGRWPRER